MRQSDREQRHVSARYATDPSVKRLTPREHAVARLLAAGVKDIVIARRLGLSLATVKNYIRRVQIRLDLDSRDAVAAWVTARVAPDDPDGRLRRIDDVRSA